MIEQAGFTAKTTEIMYMRLSDYTHSGFLSLIQSGQLPDEVTHKEASKIALLEIASFLALTVKLLGTKFPQAQAVIDSSSKELKVLLEELWKRTNQADYLGEF